MMVLSCLASVLIQEWVVAQSNFTSTVDQLKPVTQIVPVYQIQKQVEQLTEEQNTLRNRLQTLENRVSTVEEQQFAPTVFLEGEVVLGLTGAVGRDLNDSTVLQSSVELSFNTSFTGEDVLQIGLEGGNSGELSYVGDITFEGRLDSPSDTDSGRFELDELSYTFPISDRASLYISTTGDDINDFNSVTDDAVSEFGAENPINNLLEDYGLQLEYELTDDIEISLGYFSDDANEPDSGAGLFNGNYSAFAQLEFEPSDRISIGLTYVQTYNDSSLETDTGSLRSQIDLDRPVIGNSYGVSASFLPSSKVAVGGWVGWTNASVIDLGDANVWNYAFTLALLDVGQENNILGFVIGQEPRLTNSEFEIDDRTSDPDTSFHVEAFYRSFLSEQIAVTPGLVWVTAPNHDNSNPDIFLFTVRTTLEF
ncbi:MAG: iron uptake porin [Cyanophyceae cyanobacterium]